MRGEMHQEILESGFIPNQICEKLPASFDDIENLASELPKVLANEQIVERVQQLGQEKDISNLNNSELERAMLLYSYVGHAYMWGKKHVENTIPKELATTWFAISEKLERPPILSYASYALNNWKMLDDTKPFDLENIVIMQNFLGGVDEDWFIMIHVAIEYEAKVILSNLKSYFLDENLDKSLLEKSLESIKKINSIMNRMPEKCDPFIYYNRVRPYIFGWKNNPATPEGVIYEGVEDYNGEPQLFRGETGAQSSIVPALDALLGVTHSNDPLREYLDEMRLYMPKEHRELLNGLDEWSENKRKNLSIDEKSRMILNEIINEVHTFRDKHLEYARVYIFEQSLTNNSNSNIVGTGGTPFMKYLDKHLQETVPSND
jgi:indoleamine 2,3-dioxygenase